MTCILLSAAIVIFAANILGTITGFGVVVMAFPFITGLLATGTIMMGGAVF